MTATAIARSTRIDAALSALLVEPVAGEPPPRPAPERLHETLAEGRPESHHPLSDASGRGAQLGSIATKLSSTAGQTQERRHETLAEGHPGPRYPLSGDRG